MDNLHLTHEELINPRAKYAEKVLWPWQIPIHPKVYDSKLAYTLEFVEQVRAKVPESIRRDVLTIERMLNTTLNLSVEDTAIKRTNSQFRDDLEYTQIWSRVEPTKKTVGLEIGGTNIDIDPVNVPRCLIPESHHPMSKDKLRAYAFETEPDLKIHTWYIHNIMDHGIMGELYLRNFAIVFNNLGLDRC
jgi:hypothetical protein